MHTVFLTSLKTTDTCEVEVKLHACYWAGGAGVLHLTQAPSGVWELICKQWLFPALDHLEHASVLAVLKKRMGNRAGEVGLGCLL